MTDFWRTNVRLFEEDPDHGFEDWDPAEIGLEVVAGDPKGRVKYLRKSTDGEGILRNGIFHAQPYTAEWTLESDETLLLLEGELVIEVVGGATYDVGAGDVVSLRKGSRIRWTAKTPFRELFVMSG